MCMIDDSDGNVTMLSERTPVARIAHKCAECARDIRPGERYTVERFVFEGSLSAHKTCGHCLRVREWLRDECGGWLFGGIEEDIREHAAEGYGIAVKMMAVGMARCWLRKDGQRLWPLPRRPK